MNQYDSEKTFFNNVFGKLTYVETKSGDKGTYLRLQIADPGGVADVKNIFLSRLYRSLFEGFYKNPVNNLVYSQEECCFIENVVHKALLKWLRLGNTYEIYLTENEVKRFKTKVDDKMIKESISNVFIELERMVVDGLFLKQYRELLINNLVRIKEELQKANAKNDEHLRENKGMSIDDYRRKENLVTFNLKDVEYSLHEDAISAIVDNKELSPIRPDGAKFPISFLLFHRVFSHQLDSILNKKGGNSKDFNHLHDPKYMTNIALYSVEYYWKQISDERKLTRNSVNSSDPWEIERVHLITVLNEINTQLSANPNIIVALRQIMTSKGYLLKMCLFMKKTFL
jgi:hypothetical protein